MAVTTVTVISDGAGGSTELTLNSGSWALNTQNGFWWQSWQFGGKGELKIRRLEMFGARLYIERNTGDGSHFELTVAIDSPNQSVSIIGHRQSGGTITVRSPITEIVHGPNEGSDFTKQLNLW